MFYFSDLEERHLSIPFSMFERTCCISRKFLCSAKRLFLLAGGGGGTREKRTVLRPRREARRGGMLFARKSCVGVGRKGGDPQ